MSGGDRPLLVLHDEEEGHLIYDLFLLDDDGEDVMTCLPRPVAQFASLIHWCCSFAVSGGSVLGVKYDWNETYFHDTVMKAGGYDFWERQDIGLQIRDSEGQLVRWWPMCRRYASRRLGGSHRDRPAMLPMADGAVVRMDTILFDGIYSFEILRRREEEEGGMGQWHAAPLPSPPVGQLAENEIVFVTAYLAAGTRVWISLTQGHLLHGHRRRCALSVAEGGNLAAAVRGPRAPRAGAPRSCWTLR
ncbi:hypothetical protein BS78_06G229200 [Paspalum vaginatum]|nr:hypothetical protein BS78_06G229200 [Paspalum vaginatum]